MSASTIISGFSLLQSRNLRKWISDCPNGFSKPDLSTENRAINGINKAGYSSLQAVVLKENIYKKNYEEDRDRRKPEFPSKISKPSSSYFVSNNRKNTGH